MKIYITTKEIKEKFGLPFDCELVFDNSYTFKTTSTEEMWIIKDLSDVKTSQLIKNARKVFNTVSVYDEKNIDTQFPAPQKTLTVGFRKTIKSDDEHHGKSYNEFIAEKDKTYMTMRQYLILATQLKKEGIALDVVGWTQTSSRWIDGSFVSCGTSNGGTKLYLRRGYVDHWYPDDGPREQLLIS